MNLARVDLNLLNVFDAVMRERNVTRAGERIGMTQPAVSNALNRLRHLLGDALFVRGADGMRPTARALELAGPVRHALEQIETALDPPEFVPAESTRTFRLAMSEYPASVLLPALARRLEEEAPGIDLRVRSSDNVDAAALLDANEIDFAIGNFPDLPKRFERVTLFEESYVCMMRRDHPLAKGPLTLEEFAAAKHLLITLAGETKSFVDDALAEQGLTRRIAMTAYHFLVAPRIVAKTDMVTTLARRTAERVARINPVHLSPLPLPPRLLLLALLWQRRFSNHPAHEWMRALLVDVCRRI